MKKIISVALSLILIIVIALVIFINNQNLSTIPKDEKILSVKTNYALTYSENKNFNVDIYNNNPMASLLYANSYNSYICNDNKGNICKVNITSISIIGEEVFQKNKYYIYRLMIKIPNLGVDFQIFPANLIIETSDKTYEIALGNIDIIPSINNNITLGINNLYGICNIIDGYKSLCGIVISFKNETNNPITIESIALGNGLLTSLNDAVLIDEELANDTQISTYIPHYYYLMRPTQNNVLTIPAQSENTYLFPIYYERKLFVNSTYLDFQTSMGRYLLDSFSFFNNYFDLDALKNCISENKYA